MGEVFEKEFAKFQKDIKEIGREKAVLRYFDSVIASFDRLFELETEGEKCLSTLKK